MLVQALDTVTCQEWKLAAGYFEQTKYAALTANHTIGTFPSMHQHYGPRGLSR